MEDDRTSYRFNSIPREVSISKGVCSMARVKDKVAIVTGGALGIGKATCLILAKEGAKVAITDMLEKEGHEALGEIKALGGEAGFWHLDVSHEKEVEKVFTGIFNKFGRIDVLVNNAGIAGANKPTHEITDEEWDKIMNVNGIRMY